MVSKRFSAKLPPKGGFVQRLAIWFVAELIAITFQVSKIMNKSENAKNSTILGN